MVRYHLQTGKDVEEGDERHHGEGGYQPTDRRFEHKVPISSSGSMKNAVRVLQPLPCRDRSDQARRKGLSPHLKRR